MCIPVLFQAVRGCQNISCPLQETNLSKGITDVHLKLDSWQLTTNSKSVVRSAHFTLDSFSNLQQYQAPSFNV